MSLSVPTNIKASRDIARGSYLSISDYGDMDEPPDYDSEKHLGRDKISPAEETIYKSITHKDHQDHRFYKPISNRSWVLCLFLVAITICIVLLELAIRTHPDGRTIPDLGPRPGSVERRSMLYIRQNALANTTAIATSSSSEPAPGTTTSLMPGSSSDTTVPSTTITGTTFTQSDDNTDPTTTVTVGQPAPDNQLTMTTSSATGAPNPDNELVVTSTTVGQPAADNQITITSTSITVPQPNGNDELIITTTTSKPSPLGDDQTITTTPAPGEPNPDDGLLITTGGGSGAPNPADQITITTNNGGTGAPNPDNQITITTTTAPMPGAPNPNNEITITTGGSVNVPQANPGSQVTITTNAAPALVTLAGLASVVSDSLIVSGTGVVGTIPQVAAASIVSGSLVVSGSSVIATVQQGSIQGTSAGAAAIGLVTLTDSVGNPTATVAYTGNVIVTGTDGMVSTISYNGDIVLTDSKGIATNTLSDAVVLTDSNGKATKTLSYAGNTVLTNSDGVATKTVLFTGVATQAAAAVDTNAKAYKFTQGSYFLAVYLPNIIGVLLQSSWLIVFMGFKLMEPFYRLASPGGATAETTLLADYMTAGLSASVLKTAAEGHWVLILVGLVQLFLAISMVFVSGSMKVKPTAYCKPPDKSMLQPCSPVWVVNIDMIRPLEVLLVACFSMIIMIMVLNRKRVSGVYSDPSRISTVADVLVHKPLIHEIRDIPSSSTSKDVAHDLRDNRYMLGTFFDNDGREQYGIVKINVGLDHTQTFTKEPFYKTLYRHIGASLDNLTEHMNKSLPFLPDFLCMSLSLTLLAIVLAYYAIDGYTTTNAFNNWMNSSKLGPGVLLTTLGVCIGFFVKRKERYFRLSHSYVILSKGPTLASEAVTRSTHTSSFDSVYHAGRGGNFNLVLLALAAISSDIILMMAPSIPFSPSQTKDVYRVSTFMVLALSFLIFVISAYITFKEWAEGTDAKSTECPETLAAVLIRLCASRFVDEKNVMGLGPWTHGTYNDHDEMQRIRYEGVDGKRRYTYGVMEGLDGVQRHMIEEDVHARPHILVT